MSQLTWSGTNIAPVNINQVWSNVIEIIDVVNGVRSYASRKRDRLRNQKIRQHKLDEYIKQEPKKSKQVLHLICRIKGEKIYEDKKTKNNDIKISITDIDMLDDIIKTKMEVSNVI